MDESQRIRYARHIALPEVGAAGQQRLLDASVLIIGLGGLGCAAATYLAAAGVGRLVLNDFDIVDPTNLQRQILYRESDIGRRKTDAAGATLAVMNAGTGIVIHDGRLDAAALRTVLAGVDVVLDCSDNFGTRFSLNSACVATGTPLVSGAAVRLAGQVASFGLTDGKGPCYACLFDESGETLEDCAGNGVLAPLVGVIGTMQAVETVRLLAGIGEASSGRLLRFDVAEYAWRESRFERDPKCTVCA
jgi:adenylyltransferase/sulfurtransferase